MNVDKYLEVEKKMEQFLKINQDQVDYYYRKSLEKVERICREGKGHRKSLPAKNYQERPIQPPQQQSEHGGEPS